MTSVIHNLVSRSLAQMGKYHWANSTLVGQVLVEEQEPGVWLVRTATVIPDNEIWLHQPKVASDLQNAFSWAQTNTPTDTNIDILLEKLSDQD